MKRNASMKVLATISAPGSTESALAVRAPRGASAVSASRMASPPAATSSVLKRSGVPMAAKIGAPRPSSIRKAATVAIEIVATTAIRSPAKNRRHGQRQLDTKERLSARQPHAARRLEHVRRHGTQPDDDVSVEDEERVGDERDLDRSHRDARQRHEQLEERETRDHVQEVGEDAQRRVEEPEAKSDERQCERDDKANPNRDEGQLDVLNRGRAGGCRPSARGSSRCKTNRCP